MGKIITEFVMGEFRLDRCGFTADASENYNNSRTKEERIHICFLFPLW